MLFYLYFKNEKYGNKREKVKNFIFKSILPNKKMDNEKYVQIFYGQNRIENEKKNNETIIFKGKK